MEICSKIKRQYNEAVLLGQNSLEIAKYSVSENEIEDLKDCGFNISEKNDEKKGKLLIITD